MVDIVAQQRSIEVASFQSCMELRVVDDFLFMFGYLEEVAAISRQCAQRNCRINV